MWGQARSEPESTPEVQPQVQQQRPRPQRPTGAPQHQQPQPQQQYQQKYEAKYFGDYDEERELRQKRLPIIYSNASRPQQLEIMYGKGAAENEEQIVEQFGPIKYRPGLKPVLGTPNFSISDMHIYDSIGKNIIGTFATIVIKPHCQVAPLEIKTTETDIEKQKRVMYEIMNGQGLICIGNFTRHVMKGDIFWVEPNVEHNFFNTTNEVLVYRLFLDAYLDLRDRYFPSARAKEVAKESRREVFNSQLQRNVPVDTTRQQQQQQQQQQYRSRSEDKFT